MKTVVRWFAAAAVLALVSAGACFHGIVRTGLPECPQGGDWSGYLTEKAPMQGQALNLINVTSMTVAGELDLSKSNTNIPEFNDCNRFLVKNTDGQLVFDSLF